MIMQNFIKIGTAIKSLIQHKSTPVALYVYGLCLMHIHVLAIFKTLDVWNAPPEVNLIFFFF